MGVKVGQWKRAWWVFVDRKRQRKAKRLDPELYPSVLLLARTGLRLGEALALQVGDIDLEARHIQVQRTWGSRCNRERRPKWLKSKSPSTVMWGEVLAIKRWSIYRKKASSSRKRMSPIIPKPCKN